MLTFTAGDLFNVNKLLELIAECVKMPASKTHYSVLISQSQL